MTMDNYFCVYYLSCFPIAVLKHHDHSILGKKALNLGLMVGTHGSWGLVYDTMEGSVADRQAQSQTVAESLLLEAEAKS